MSTNQSASVLTSPNEAGYPDAVVSISSRNSSACKRFAQAQEALSRDEDFELAQRYMQGYRNLVRYEEFYKQDNRTEPEPLLSVVVVAYNTGKDLVRCLKSVFAGSLKQIEVIVVDNGKNADVLSTLLAMPILYVKTPMNLILSEGRNIGVSMAKAPIAAFLDDDALADSDFCKNALEPFRDSTVYAIRGKVLPKTKGAFLGTMTHYDFGDKPIPQCINTEGNSAWRLDAYREFGGMDPLLFGHEGTDVSIAYSLAYGLGSTWYWPKMCIYHDYAVTEDKNSVKQKRHELMTKFMLWKNPAAYGVLTTYEEVLREAKEKEATSLPEQIPQNSQNHLNKSDSICFFINTLGPGGAERQVVTLARSLASAGKTVHILCCRLDGLHGHYLPLLAGSAVTCRVLDAHDAEFGKKYAEQVPERFQPFLSLPIDQKAVFALMGALEQIRPGILHCYLDDASCIGGCAGLACGIPGIVLSARSSIPGNLPDIRHLAGWTHTVYRFLLQHNNVLLEANSSIGARDYEKWLALPKNTITVNTNGFDAEDLPHRPSKTRKEVLRSLGLSGTAPIVIWIGKFNVVKKPEDMAAVAALVKKKVPNVRFLAVGNILGQEEQSKELIQKYLLQDTLDFLGSRQDVFDLLYASDVLLLTSIVEGFPNAVMEAMVAGLPVVATQVGAIPEMVLPDAGVVHAVGDVAGMAESVAMLLRSPELRQHMGRIGQERAMRLFTVEKLTARALSKYEDACAN